MKAHADKAWIVLCLFCAGRLAVGRDNNYTTAYELKHSNNPNALAEGVFAGDIYGRRYLGNSVRPVLP